MIRLTRGGRATFILVGIGLALGLAVVAVGELGAADTRERVRTAELATLRNEATQTAASIARRFDEIRALVQATGEARIGLSEDELLRALSDADLADLADTAAHEAAQRAQAHLIALFRAMPAEVQGMSLSGGGRDAEGLYSFGVAAFTETRRPESDASIVRQPPGAARLTLARGRAFDALVVKATGRHASELTAPLVLYRPSERAAFLQVPIVGADGRALGLFGIDIQTSYLLSRVAMPATAQGKLVYLIDAQRDVVERIGPLREVGISIDTSDAVTRILAGEVVEGTTDARPWLLGTARTPTLTGARPDLTMDVTWYVVVARAADAVYVDVDATLGQLRLMRIALAAVLLLAGLALGVVLDAVIRQRRQLAAATQHKSDFLANMSHELRTPLNAIIGFADVLEDKMFGDLNAKQAEYVGDISTSGRHLLDLVNEILDLSKVEAGRMELERSDFAVAETIRATLTFVRERAASHAIQLSADVPADLGSASADERKSRQVLLNLLSNAVKFTPAGGAVRLVARRQDAELVVSVSDTGIGIAPEDQARVFEEFRQVGRPSDQSREGTGLGLTLAKRFVELHGGRIWLESAVGKGTTFTFAIPAGHTASVPVTA